MKNLIQFSRCLTNYNIRRYHSFILSVTKPSISVPINISSNLHTTFTKLLCTNNHESNIQAFLHVRYLSLSLCNFAKNRDKGKDKKKKVGVVHIDENEMCQLINVEKYKKNMDHVLDLLKNDLIKNISTRSSVGSIEELKFKMDDKTYSIQELAQIARKPKMVAINCSTFPQALKPILNALSSSGMNINPQQEGTTIYVPTPKVTKEHREQLAKNAKSLLNKHKISLRDLQNKQVKVIKEKEHISLDLAHRVEEQVKALCQKYISEAEKLVDTKQKEVLGE